MCGNRDNVENLYLPPNFAVNLLCSVMSDSLWHQTVAHGFSIHFLGKNGESS